jgi:hypothetical protein
MEKSKLILRSLINSLGAAVYTGVVSWFMFNSSHIFGKVESFWGPFAMLLLFVISAATVGGLVLGKPFLLYLDGEKKAGVEMFLCSLAWLAVIGILIFIIRPW